MSKELSSTVYASPLGALFALATPTALRALVWNAAAMEQYGSEAETANADKHPILRATGDQLKEYFAGKRTRFELELDPIGTEFQLAAWRALQTIPFGETRSYSQQARAIDRPTAVRAVGAANGRNPISIVVPCHRVVGADGSLTGFGGGLDNKRWLLDHESMIAGPDGRGEHRLPPLNGVRDS